MKINLDSAVALTSMKLWREALELEIPMKDEFKLHFMQQRKPILNNYLQTAKAWSMLLNRAKPIDGAAEELTALLFEIKSFEQWAIKELEVIDHMGIAEEVDAGLDQLLADPSMKDVVDNLAKHFKNRPKPDK